MRLTLINNTSSIRTYVSGTFSVPANGTLVISTNPQQLSVLSDPALRADILALLAALTDGSTIFNSAESIGYLELLLNYLKPMGDALGNLMVVGQTTMSLSLPVTLASDQSALSISRPSAYTTGTLTAAAQTVAITVAEGQSAWSVQLSGTFSSGSQVAFEGSYDNSNWFFLNGRRNTDQNTNDISSTFDTSPSGGTAPSGGNPSYWRGSVAAVRFFRVRCITYTALDNIIVGISTSSATGAVFLNAALPTNADKFVTGTIAALNGTVTGFTQGCAAITFNVTGTFVATLMFEGTNDSGATYNALVASPPFGSIIATTTTIGIYSVNCAGYGQVRIKASSYTSGTITVSAESASGLNAIKVYNTSAASLVTQANNADGSGTAITSTNSALDVTPKSVYNTTMPSPSNTASVPLQSNFHGALVTQFRNSFRNVTSNATTVVKSGSGVLHSVIINNNATNGTIVIYDNTAGSGTVMFTFNIGSPSGGLLSTSGQPGPFSTGPLGLEFATGLTIVTSGSTSNNVTLLYR